jgi:glycosyltransferase involved in cell wall biosynthesis
VSLRVGINLLFLTTESSGAGRYVQELVPALLDVEPTPELTAFVGSDAPAEMLESSWSDRVDWVRYGVGVSSRAHLVAQLAAIPVTAKWRSLDVIHSPANIGPLWAVGTARVVTLLDVIWLHQREAWEAGRAARAFALLSRMSARTADRVLTISSSARDDVVASLRLDEKKVDVTPLGVRLPSQLPAGDIRSVRERLGIVGPVVLCVAQKRPYKNQEALIRALPKVGDASLVLVGSPTTYEEALRSLATKLGVDDRVRFLAYVTEEELEDLYRLASCFVLPSLIEGFGLPVLEAMARNVPVACSDRPALPEVVGDAALLFDPLEPATIAAAVERLLRDTALREELVARGRERCRKFTWARTAEATLVAYRKAAGGSSPTRR